LAHHAANAYLGISPRPGARRRREGHVNISCFAFKPQEFKLVVNQKAARQFGLQLPPSLLVRADDVIE
jgi:hypothetical protein